MPITDGNNDDQEKTVGQTDGKTSLERTINKILDDSNRGAGNDVEAEIKVAEEVARRLKEMKNKGGGREA